MARLLHKFEFLTLVMAVCVISMGLMGFYLKLFGMEPPLPVEAVHLPIVLCMLAVMVIRLPQTLMGAMSILPYVLLGALFVISYRWSVSPTMTMKEAIFSCIYMGYIACAAWRYNWRILIEGMWVAMFAQVLLSFVLYFAVPNIGQMQEIHVGAMAGIWVEKNVAGQIGVFGSLLALARLAISPRTIITSSVSFLIFTLFLLMSTSKTSLVAYILGCGVFAWVFMMRRSRPVFLLTTWFSVFLGFFGITYARNNVDELLGLLGRSSTFTGRAEIWKSLAISLNDRPLLGHGYSAFWDRDIYIGRTLVLVDDDLGYKPNHSHNSIIEMQLGLGMVGVYLLVGAIIFYFLLSVLRVRNSHGAYFAVPFTLAAAVIASFESILAMPSNFGGCMIVLVAAKMVRPSLDSESKSSIQKTLRFFAGRSQTTSRGYPAYSRQRAHYNYVQPSPLQQRINHIANA